MITADTITDEQIRELWADYAITISEASMALSTDARRRYSFETNEMWEARKREHAAARARCAEILNQRGKEQAK